MHTNPTIQILIIDDDPHARNTLTDLLEALGHTVVAASTGVEGLAVAHTQIPDLILLDIMMPGIDGFTVCEQLRAHPRTAEVPILMITALNDRASRLRGIEVGADEFLTKPFDNHEIRLRVQTLARVNRYRQLLNEREQTVAALTQARDAALEASRLKSAFLATVSHELRTPLIGILGMGELLAHSITDEEQRTFAQTIWNSGQELLALINDILAYTSLEAGSTILNARPFDLVATITAMTEALRPAAAAKGLELRVMTDEGLAPQVVGDVSLLSLVLRKLLDNAIKFTVAGQITVGVSVVEESATQMTVHIRVRDSGIGVAEAIRPQLFAPFQQADSSPTRRYGGLGLGLALCKQATDLLGGTIGIDPTAEPGATFWVQLPFSKASG